MRRSSLLATIHLLLASPAAIVVAPMMSGCTFVQAPPQPRPLQGYRRFYLEPLDFSGVDAEPDHVKDIGEKYVEEMKDEGDMFTYESAPGDEIITVRAKVVEYEKGISMGITSTDSKIKISFQFLLGTEVLETAKYEAAVSQDDVAHHRGIALGGYTDGHRLQLATEEIVENLVDFLQDATRGEKQAKAPPPPAAETAPAEQAEPAAEPAASEEGASSGASAEASAGVSVGAGK